MIDRTADWHTHSSLTDGADTPEQMAAAAAASGLATWGLSDHVRADSTWVDAYVERVHGLDAGPVAVRCGVEAKILDSAGRLDLPAGLAGLDYVLIADHQYPGADGPVHPRDVAADVAAGRLTAPALVDRLVAATARSVAVAPFPPILAHLFSVLPKCGVSEDDVEADHVAALADACVAAGARVEANEKWRCPSPRVLGLLAAAGVGLTAGSDAHRHEDVGRWRYVDEIVESSTVGAS